MFLPAVAEAEFRYSELLPTGADDTPFGVITTEGVETVEAQRAEVPEDESAGDPVSDDLGLGRRTLRRQEAQKPA
jgi:hypothetical protein